MRVTRETEPAARSGRVLVARIGAAQGLRGEVRLWAFTADPMAIRDYGPLTADDGRRFVIESLRSGKNFLVARFSGVGDRTVAQALTNVDLYVPRNRLPATEADEFYHADLIGLKAVSRDGRTLGTVVAVHNFGAGDLIELMPTTGRSSVFVPFIQAAVPLVDLPNGKLIIDADVASI